MVYLKRSALKSNLRHVINTACRDRSAFEKKGLDEDIISLRYKHHQNRLIDILNRVLEERRKIKHDQMREEARLMHEGNQQPHSAHAQSTKRSPGVSMDRT